MMDMLEINNRNLCKFCFTARMPNQSVCPRCGGAAHVRTYHGTLANGAILAGKYLVGRVIGKGGFGVTYQCYNLQKNLVVAVKEYMPDTLAYRKNGSCKVLANSINNEKCYREGAVKFLEEAKMVSRFNGNPNITKVYEFFYENNTSYYVMEFLDGTDLKGYIERKGGRIGEGAMIKVINSVSNALVDLHSVKVLHRDISPDNIFVCRNGDVKLIDFGAARQLVSEASNSLSVILKPGFAPFEQYQKKGNQGPWTDIYALGATAYYAVTGRMIPDAMSRLERNHIDMSGMSSSFAAVVSKMIAHDIKARYRNVAQLMKAVAPLMPANKVSSAEKQKSESDDSQQMPERVREKITATNFCSMCGKPVPKGY